jgi:hypothetical protein
MPSTGPDEVRRFSDVAKQRYDDARFLLGHRNTAAIYLAGYAVECVLKALWLSRVPPRGRAKQVESFRGEKGHDLEWLKVQYLRRGGEAFPPAIAKAFGRVKSWGTHLRYNPGAAKARNAVEFLRAVEELIEWANERL